MKNQTREIVDPFTNKTVSISHNLTDRLRGKYACGPTMANGESEFGWQQYDTPSVQHEAADIIDAQNKVLEFLTDRLLVCTLISGLDPDVAALFDSFSKIAAGEKCV